MTINSIDDKYGKWLIPLIIAKHFLLHYFSKIKKNVGQQFIVQQCYYLCSYCLVCNICFSFLLHLILQNFSRCSLLHLRIFLYRTSYIIINFFSEEILSAVRSNLGYNYRTNAFYTGEQQTCQIMDIIRLALFARLD